jgi:hypothetical protein
MLMDNGRSDVKALQLDSANTIEEQSQLQLISPHGGSQRKSNIYSAGFIREFVPPGIKSSELSNNSTYWALL